MRSLEFPITTLALPAVVVNGRCASQSVGDSRDTDSLWMLRDLNGTGKDGRTEGRDGRYHRI